MITKSTSKQLIVSRPSIAGLLSTVVLATGLLVTVEPAQAAPPGENGRIAFAIDGDIYATNDDGLGQTRLTDGPAQDAEPAWSPDGEKIAFVRSQDGNDEVYVMNADGSDPSKLTNDPADDHAPSWAPDSEKIAFVSTRDGNQEIYAMNADGSDPSRLTEDAAEDSDPAWSPDGTKIAFASSRGGSDNNYATDIYTMDPDGSALDRLTDSSAEDPSGVYVYFASSPAWSPDGDAIAFESGQYNPHFRTYIDVVNADGSGEPERIATSDHSDSSPTWSPSGTKIAFAHQARYPEYPADADIRVVNADGSEPSNLTDTAEANESSPDWGSAANISLPSDTTPPDTTLESLSSPSGVVRDRSASFFFSSEPRTTFECSLDGAEFGPCGSGKSSYSQENYYELPDGEHTFRVRAKDPAGNTDPNPASHTWTVDSAAPKGSVTISDGATSTKKPAVKLSLSARDPKPGSGTESMRFSNDGGTWSAWEPYAKSKTWTLGGGKGTKTVYVEYRDEAGNVSTVATDTINKTR